MIANIGSIPVFVSDQECALEFYRDKLGFEVVMEAPYPEGFRWIAVTPQKGQTELILFQPAMCMDEDKVEETKKRVGIWTGIIFLTDDIQSTYKMLRERGVVFDAEPSQQFWGGLETWFCDPDGNRFHLVQQPEFM